MRRRIAAIAALLLCAPSPEATAGTYRINFDRLIGSAGRVVTTSITTDDGFTYQATNMKVVFDGPSVGLQTVAGLDSVLSVWYDPAGVPEGFGLASVSGSFTAGDLGGTAVGWSGVLGTYQDGARWDWVGTAPSTLTTTFSPGTFTDRIALEAYGPNTDEIVGLTLSASPPVPEPSGLLLGGIGLAAAITATAGRPSSRRSTCRRS